MPSASDRSLLEEVRDAARGAGSQDPLVGDLRKGGLLPLLVLHFAAVAPCYGSELRERVAALTSGAVQVNPNTLYPLLRRLETRGLLAGDPAAPAGRGRRYYSTTAAGRAERDRLIEEVGPRLRRISRSIAAIRRELEGAVPEAAEPG